MSWNVARCVRKTTKKMTLREWAKILEWLKEDGALLPAVEANAAQKTEERVRRVSLALAEKSEGVFFGWTHVLQSAWLRPLAVSTFLCVVLLGETRLSLVVTCRLQQAHAHCNAVELQARLRSLSQQLAAAERAHEAAMHKRDQDHKDGGW